MRIPIPQVGAQIGQEPAPSATAVQPVNDQRSRQMQQLGAASAQVGEATFRIAENLQNQYDEGRVREGLVEFAKFTQSRTEDPKDGFLQRSGRDASKYEVAKFMRELDDERDRLGQGFDNPVQRELFSQNVEKHMLGVRERVFAHSAQETQKYAAGQAKVLGEQAERDAIAATLDGPVNKQAAQAAQLIGASVQQEPGSKPQLIQPQQGDFDRAKFAKNNAVDQTLAYAATVGLAPDDPRTKELVLQRTTNIHNGIVQGFIARQQPQKAKDYLATVDKKEVDPRVYSELQKDVEEADSASAGMRVGLETIDELDKAAKITTPEEQDQHDRELGASATSAILGKFRAGKIDGKQARFALAQAREVTEARREVWNANAVKALQAAEKVLLANKLITPASPSFPQQVRDDLIRYGQYDHAVAFAESKRYATDYQVYSEVLERIKSGSLRGLSRNDFFATYRGSLADREWNVALAGYEASNDTRAADKSSLYTVDMRIDDFARRHSALPRELPKGQSLQEAKATEKYARLFKMVSDAVDSFESDSLQGKRKATPKEVQDILDYMETDRAWRDQWGSDAEVPWVELTDAEEQSAYINVGEAEPVVIAKIPSDPHNPGSNDDVLGEIATELRRNEFIPRHRDIAEIWALAGRPKTIERSMTEARRRAVAEWQRKNGLRPPKERARKITIEDIVK